MKLPESFRSIMWSYDFDACDTDTMPRTIIVQTLQYGTLSDWRFITKVYGKDTIKNVIESSPSTVFRSKLLPLLNVAFNSKR